MLLAGSRIMGPLGWRRCGDLVGIGWAPIGRMGGSGCCRQPPQGLYCAHRVWEPDPGGHQAPGGRRLSRPTDPGSRTITATAARRAQPGHGRAWRLPPGAGLAAASGRFGARCSGRCHGGIQRGSWASPSRRVLRPIPSGSPRRSM